MSVFRVRKVAFINFGLLFIFLACWISWYIYPLAKSFFVEEDLFYGKVSYAAIPSLFGGSNLPFFDKTFFGVERKRGAARNICDPCGGPVYCEGDGVYGWGSQLG